MCSHISETFYCIFRFSEGEIPARTVSPVICNLLYLSQVKPFIFTSVQWLDCPLGLIRILQNLLPRNLYVYQLQKCLNIPSPQAAA